MAKTRQQKEDLVKALQDKLDRAKSVIFADYKGLTMKQLSELRNKLFEAGAEFNITKNTLLQRSLSSSTLNPPSSSFTGPTATLFAYDDEVSPLKLLVKALMDAGIGKIKGGFLGADYLDETRILQLSALPTKDELRGKTIGILVAPLQEMISVLQGNLRNLVYAIDQIRLQKGGE